MISEIAFSPLADSVPYDIEGNLLDFLTIGPSPAPTSTARFPAHLFSGSNGYRSNAGGTLYRGFSALSVRIAASPDYQALDGVGPVALAHVGTLGPTIPEYSSWGFGLRVSGLTVDLLAMWQDVGGSVLDAVIATIPVTTGVQLLGFSRERTVSGTRTRATVDGVLAGEIASVANIAYPPVAPLTLACRDNQGVFDRFYIGSIERITLSVEASSALQESHAWLRRAESERNRDSGTRYYTAGYARRSARSDPSSRDTVYHRYRVRPLAEIQGLLEARAQAVDAAALPPYAYGLQLARWESSVSAHPVVGTIADRQRRVQALFSDRGGFRIERMESVGARLTGDPSVYVVEYENRQSLPTTATPDAPATNPWWVRGFGTVDLTASGLRMTAPSGANLEWSRDARTAEACAALDHVPMTAWGFGTRLLEGGAFSARLVSLSGTDSDQWAGITLRGDDGRAIHVGVYDIGGSLQVSARTTTDYGAYTAWSPITPIDIGESLSVFWNAQEQDWYLSRGNTPSGTIGAPLNSTLGRVYSIGLTLQSIGALATTLDATWGDAVIQRPNATTGRRFYIVAPNPTTVNANQQTGDLRSQDRPTALGHVTYAPEMICDEPRSPLEYTPLTGSNPGVPAIADAAAGVTRTSGKLAESLHTFQSDNAPVPDRIRADDLLLGAGASVNFEVPGPDNDRNAVTVSFGAASYLTANRIDFMNPNLGQVGVILIYRFNPGSPGIILEKRQSVNVRITLQILGGNLSLFLLDGVTIESLSVPAQAPNQWHALGFYTDDVGESALATSAAEISDSFGMAGLTNQGRWTVGTNFGGVSADVSVRWVAWFRDQFIDETDLMSAVQRVELSLP